MSNQVHPHGVTCQTSWGPHFKPKAQREGSTAACLCAIFHFAVRGGACSPFVTSNVEAPLIVVASLSRFFCK